ncbi:Ig-like domain repeat protein [Methanobrevibacter sp.]|uniref:Ppx/GppA phosphatase family protein n=1 Tax=Methanobrevibacter sp. TaxID=66852 RepID=UPI00388F5CF6
MKYKFFYVLIIFLICCSLSGVVAADINETSDIYQSFTQDEVVSLESENTIKDIPEAEPILNNNETIEITADKDISSNSNNATSSNPNKLYGIVDFGSNSIELTVYELKNSGKTSKVVSQEEKSVTAIYVINNTLTDKGIDELISIYEDFEDLMDYLNVENRYYFATASLRKIDNSAEVIETVKNNLGIEIHLLEGETEAMTTFKANNMSDITTDDGLVIDLGGGSTEVIKFINRTPVELGSMPIGSNSCYLEYVSAMFPNETEIENIRNRTLAELDKLNIDNSKPIKDLYGNGGGITNTQKVLAYLNYIDDNTRIIPFSMLNTLFDELKNNTKEDFLKILNIVPKKINTLIPAMVITKTVMEYFNVSYLHYCKKNIDDGILAGLIQNETSKKDSNLSVSDISTTCDEDCEILVTVASNATGSVTVKLNGNTYYSTISNGTALILTSKLPSGDYKAKIEYGGDDYYLPQSQKINIHVKNASVDASDMARGWNSDYDYQVKLIDENGNGIEDKLITFTVGKNQYYTKTNEDGIARINPRLAVGTYSISVSSPLLNDSMTNTLKIVKRITGNKNLNVYYNSNQNLKIKIIGDDGKAESASKSVSVMIDNKKNTYKTDANGYITIKLDKNLAPATHTIKIQYKEFAVENKIVVKHSLQSKKVVTAKKSAKKVVLTAALKSSNKNLIKNKKIKFKINGKTYTAKTNSKGIAKLTIKKNVIKNLKKGKHSVKITYLKDTITTSIKIK